jgi:sulfofructose kinase
VNSTVVCVGNLVQDEVFHVDAIPSSGIKTGVLGYEERYGGPAATAAVAICRLGGRAAYWGRVGDDPAGAKALRLMREAGVDCAGVAAFENARTLRAIVIVDARGERAIVSDRRSLPSDAGCLAGASLAGAGVVLADTRWPEGAAMAFERAKQAGIPTVLDADGGSPTLNAGLIAAADHVVFSSEGLKDHAGEGDPGTLLRRCAGRPGQVLAVTQGAAGSLWLLDGELVPVPACRVKVVDTTGCGDVFHGAYALALNEGRAPLEAARFASATAAIKAARGQGWAGMADRPAVEALMAESSASQSA